MRDAIADRYRNVQREKKGTVCFTEGNAKDSRWRGLVKFFQHF
jgi:hypothetical protein